MKKFIIHNKLFTLSIILALLLRIILTLVSLQPQFRDNDDLLRYRDWGRIAYYYGVSESYSEKHISYGVSANNQPPGTLYIDYAMFALYQTFFHTPMDELLPVVDVFFKLPPITADLLIGVLLYGILLRHSNRKNALIVSSLFLYNPIVLYNSAIWGQTDALNNFFLLLSLTLLLRNRYLFSILALFLSFFIKLSLLPLLPLMLLIIVKKMDFRILRCSLYVLLASSILMLLTLPVSLSPVTWWIQFTMQHAGGEMQHITNNAQNFWMVLFNPDYVALIPDSAQRFYGLSLSMWGYVLFSVASLPILLYILFKKSLSLAFILAALFITAFAIYLFLPRMHERYFYPVIPLLAAYIGIKNKYAIFFIFLSLLHFITLYAVWHPVPFFPQNFASLIGHSKVRWGMSLLSVLFFFLLYAKIFIWNGEQSVIKVTGSFLTRKGK